MRVTRGLVAVLFVLTLLPTSGAFGAPPDPVPDRRFGVVEAFWSPNQATELGVGWERVLFWWKALQPHSPDEWNPFYFPDDTLAEEIAQGREVVGLLATTPVWASGGDDPRLPPKNLYLPYDHPDNYWGAFVKKIVSRYQGRIDAWIIWNEPDIWDAQQSLSTWLGSEADYYQLLKVAYQAAKSVNPSAKIVFGGLTYWWDKSYGRELYLKRVLEIAAKDPTARANGFYFDVANLHLYNLPQEMYAIPQVIRQVLAAYGLSKPIWISEMNVVPHDDPVSPLGRADYRASLEEQASFIIQALALSLAGGVERIALYKMRDDTASTPDSEPYGLTRKDGAARPSFAALRAATRYLSGAKDAKWFPSKGLNSVVVRRNGEITTVLWNNSPRPITAVLTANVAKGLLVDKYGLSAEVAAVDGKYHIVLPAATASNVADGPQSYFIGGDSFMLIEPIVKPVEQLTNPSWEPPAPEQPSRSGEAASPSGRDTPTVPSPERSEATKETGTERESRLAVLDAEQRKAIEEARQRERIAALIAQAQTAIDRYDWQSGYARLQELSEVDPGNARGRELLSLLQREVKTAELRSRAAELSRLQDWAGAADTLRQLLVLYPDDGVLKAQLEGALAESDKARLLKLAEDYARLNRLDEAQRAYEQVLALDPRNRKALEGIANLQVYRWYQARSFYSR